MYYTIVTKSNNLYVHYNPHKEEYVLDDKTLGAALFTYEDGISFMEESSLPKDEFQLVKVKGEPQILTTSRKNEPALYDKLH